jgi:hypothetical protein
MHMFLSQIERIPQLNRLMEVPDAAVVVALESLGSAPGSRSFDSQSDMRNTVQNSFIADEGVVTFGPCLARPLAPILQDDKNQLRRLPLPS